MDLVGWKRVCMPKENGGLALRTTWNANKAFMAKLGWKVLVQEDVLWVKVVSAKYLWQGTFLGSEVRADSSYTWKGIMDSRQVVGDGVGKLVFDGRMIRFWVDVWLLREPLLGKALVPIPSHIQSLRVRDYWVEDDWDWACLRLCLSEEILSQLAVYTLHDRLDKEDEVFWRFSSSGCFTTKSTYLLQLQSQQYSLGQYRAWGKIWKLVVNRFLLWLMVHGRVLTNVMRQERHLVASLGCERCGFHREDVMHLFRDCTESREVWKGWVTDRVWEWWQGMDSLEWVVFNLSRTRVLTSQGTRWDAAFGVICWFL